MGTFANCTPRAGVGGLVSKLGNVGVRSALAAAVLFGAGAPVAKMLLGSVSPWMLAGLLYTGSGVGLGLWRIVRRAGRVRLSRTDWLPLAGAVFFGGVLAPVLLMFGLIGMPATGASLLLNAEGVLTAVIAWVVFRENVDRWVVLGMAAIVAGAVVLVAPMGVEMGSLLPALAVLGACLGWAIDNNLTRMVSLTDATWLAAVKGLVAGPTNLVLALWLNSALPGFGNIAAAVGVGFFAYGVSLVLYIVGLRHLGTARAGAYFSVAPFFGAVLALAFGESLTLPLVVAGVLMGIGVWLHLRERHVHDHTHQAIVHDHFHTHDGLHHDHVHESGDAPPPGQGHRHEHVHEEITHSHPHYPDAHHRHEH